MTQSMNANDLVALPTLDASDAIALALLFEKAALDEKGKTLKLPETIKESLAEVAEHREALQQEVSSRGASEVEIASVDRLVDAALRAIYYLFKAWEILIDALPEGEEAAELRAHFFGDEGLRIINLPAPVEWGAVETSLKAVDDQKLEPRFAALGAAKMLAYLRDVQARYGEVTGQRAQSDAQSPQVGVKLRALSDALRHHVAAVVGSVVRKKPATKELADTLLKPLITWERPKAKRAAKPAGSSTPEGAEGEGKGGDK